MATSLYAAGLTDDYPAAACSPGASGVMAAALSWLGMGRGVLRLGSNTGSSSPALSAQAEVIAKMKS